VRGYGAVARGGAIPDGDTMYEIGSISKVFTGLLLADAVQRGAVALDDPLQRHLPAGVVVPTWEDAPVRLWHLSTHTSGLPRLPGMQGSSPADPYAHFDAERLGAALGKVRVRWAPGSKYEYSNLAVGSLGWALAHTQGQPTFAALLAERITGPLEMRDTMVELDDAHRSRLASPYDASGEPAHTWDLAALAGAGGIRSSVHDMLRFARVQLAPGDGPLANAVRLSQQKRHDGQNGIGLALGWHLSRDGATLQHNGQTGGYHAYLAVQPATQRAVCVLANTATGAIDGLGERILQHLHGKAVAPQSFEVPAAVDRALLQRCVGTFKMDLLRRFEITLGERGLFARLTGQPALRLFPRSASEFFYREVEASITFEFDGEVAKALVLHQNGADVRCERATAK
jgi:CubicO group peptidase (beta-lactamase class C family)